MPTPDMREEEILATTPVVPNASPTDAEYAVGFVGGVASKPFFNKLWNRYSELIFKTQGTAQSQKFSVVNIVSAVDSSLLYKDYFIGLVGSDLTARTPTIGNPLRNDSGGHTGKYFISSNSSVARVNNELYPLYTDCGEDSSLLSFKLAIGIGITSLSSDGDRVGLALNCTGAYQRTEVALIYSKTNKTFIPTITVYDNAGLTGATYAGTSIEAVTLNNRTVTFTVTKSTVDGFLTINIPELNWTLNTGEPMVNGTGTNDHGFVITPQTFKVTNLIIHNEDIV